MLNYVHVSQSVLLLSLTQIVMWSKGVKSFECKSWSDSVKCTSALITFAFHGFLMYYKTTPLLYFWFIFSVLHFFIHAYKARKTIVESNEFTSDEIWHLINQLFCLYYMYSRDVPVLNLRLYGGFLCLYFILLSACAAGYSFNTPLYYLGSFMATFFVFSLKPNYDPYNISFFMSSYYFVVVSITYNNRVGRRLTLLNIA